MANIKEYKIVINGLEESINAVDSLNKQLDALEKRINALQSKSVNISTSSTSSSGGRSSNASALSAEEATQREINKLKQEGERLDAKIVATQDEIYKRVDATKQLYKETVADQKAIAAQERLVADAYSNTMQGMKAKLADIKSVINTTDLGDSDKIKQMTQEANELTSKLKEMEAAYGQYGRNVGNYANGVAEGLQKVKITVGDTVREFGSAREASRTLNNELKSMAVNGQQDTEAFKQLQQVVMELDSNIADAKKPMDDLMDAMEGIMAVANVGQGLRALFGVDDTEIQKSIKNLVALQNVLKGIESINDQIQTRQGVGKWIAPFTTQIDAATKKMLVFNRALLGTSKAAKVAAVGIKAFGTALKTAVSMGILVVVDLLMEKLMDLVESFKKVDHAAEDAKETEEAVAKAYGEGMSKITQYKSKLDAFNGSKNEEKKLVEELNKEFGDTLGTYKSVAEWQDVLKKKGDAYIETIKLQAQAQAILNAITAAYGRIQQIDFSKANGDYDTLTNKLLNLVGLGKDYMKDLNETNSHINTLTNNLDVVYKKIEQNNKKNKIGNYAPQIEKNGKKAKSALEDSQKTLNQLEIRLMKEGLNKKLRQLDEEERQTINKLKENGRKSGIEIQKVQKTYAELRQKEINEYLRNLEESVKKTARDINNIKFDINLKDIEIEADNLKNKFEDISTKGFPLSTNTLRTRSDLQNVIGNLNLDKLKNASSFNSLKAFKDDKEQVDEYYGLLENYLEEKNEEIKDYFEKLKKEVGEYDAFEWLSEQFEVDYRNELSVVRSEDIGFFGLTEDYLKNSEKVLAGSFQTRINMTTAYYAFTIEKLKENIKEQSKLNEQRIKEQWLQDEEAERDRYTKQYQELEKQKKETEDTIANFKVRTTEEQKAYEDLQKKLETINKQMEEALKLHGEKMGQLTEAKNNAIKKNELDTAKEIQNTQQKFYDLQVSNYRDMQSKLNNEISKNPIQNSWGIINISQTKKNYNEIIEASKATLNAIKDDRKKLEEDFNNGLIGQDAYNATKNQLNDLETEIKQGMYATSEASKQLIGEFVGSLNQYFQILGQSIQQIMQAVWDAEDYQIDKELDELDKWNEELKNALDEQQDIVEKHKDNVESIEDELATARGDRRQHLIDQINAEVDAQRAAQREEQRIQKEQEKAKKREEALEKKRREQEYKRNVMQAFISWHLAIANGLATQPFLPVGIAMGTLATTLGAIQYALVKSQKPYAKGGQLDGGVAQGKRHRDGGIPVLGGRASIEGGEFITNRTTTAKNIDLLEYINSKKKRVDINDLIEFYGTTPRKTIRAVRTKFEDGGYLPTLPNSLDIREQLQNIVVNQDNRPIYVSVVDINNKQEDVRRVQTLAGL